MPDRNPTPPPPTALQSWLAAFHGAEVDEFAPLRGGFWSSAFGYRVQDESLVLRWSAAREGFDMDAAAMQFGSETLPIPEVLHVGEALGGFVAISRRHEGRFIEERPAAEGEAVGTAMAGLLASLRAVPSSPGDPVSWHQAETRETFGWRDWLRAGLADDPTQEVSGWREGLAANPRIDALFQRCEERIEALLPHCPERRDLVHGDLLHQNVLVEDDDSSRVTAIFSWKCSVRGDFLFDVAWCTFWSPWHPGIAAGDLWARALAAPDLRPHDLDDAARRHHCYELQIGASHLGWYVWTRDDRELARAAAELESLLERGPRSD